MLLSAQAQQLFVHNIIYDNNSVPGEPGGISLRKKLQTPSPTDIYNRL